MSFFSAVLLADNKHRNQNEEDAKRPLHLHKNKLHKHYHHHKGNIGNAVVFNYSFPPSGETLRDSQQSFAFFKKWPNLHNKNNNDIFERCIMYMLKNAVLMVTW